VNRTCRLALLSLCLAAATGMAHASQQEELANLRQRISALQQELDKTSESKSEASDALRESERAISDSNRKLNDLSQQQRKASQSLLQMQQKSAQLEKDVQSQQALLGELLYQQYLGGRQEYLKLLLNNSDPNQLARELHYYEYIARGRATWIHTLRTNLQQLNSLTEQTKQKSDELAKLQAEEKIQKQHLEADKSQRQQVLSRISSQLKQQRREMGHLQRNENRLSQLVERLSRMLVEPRHGGILDNNRLPDDRFDGKPFDTLKGRLILPVRGVVTNRFGTPHPDSRVLWKGLFLRAASGQPVKAVAAGRVVFADWLRGFGNLLIIDHGKGYMSLYGNNETLYKQVGDTLKGGDTVAAVGNSGGNENSGLYFELRYEGKPLDPMQWVATK
jgi:septal ring factor EnvC (AmiA/AmiB activator)